jgi:hypothetical protein
MIDYGLLYKSLEYYEGHGFKRVEAPWAVSEAVDNITKPAGAQSFQLKHNNKCLVASGEQSFLYLYLKNFLPKGTYSTITPCWRYESFNFLHTKYFMKNELIKTDKVDQYELEKIVDVALGFFRPLFDGIAKLDAVQTEFGFDIEADGIELGSYGIRSCEFLDWIFGTGLAEPRTSNLINLYKKKI